ncbi:hypothetical protein [Azospirillum picis]|uniref:Uncharacterized protein n=1 Tax=Azospirillum picis TaxID=488438 RepID=A0ABU0MGL1_9PROT|nr:hypothetical protein [Azospirillum picis]MBP2298378.1 hypothetical protein [Azospirillum picis]MDQ0532573.1 hypothetical protein [Azospirillum picis]
MFALAYFLLDALAYWVVRPVLRRIGRMRVFARIGEWIGRLGPYPSLLLVLVPLGLLEPAKLLGLWLLAAGRPALGVGVTVGAELTKVILVERLFHLTKPKLLTIGWFARCYGAVTGWIAWLKATAPARAAYRLLLRLRQTGRRLVLLARRAMRA